MVISNLEISRYGGGEKKLFYDYIPFDYLFTDETTPQVIVDIGGMPALCTSLECGYTYETPSAELTDMTVNEDDLTVVITGTSLPDEIESVVIGSTPCQVTANDATSISCTLSDPVVFGSHAPIVKDAKGLLPVSDSITPYVVDLVVTGTDPSIDVNPAGQSITIFGSGFPASLAQIPSTL